MAEENDITLEEGMPDNPSLAIIDNQVILINSLFDIDLSDLYDEWREDKIKVITRAIKVIHREQGKLLKG